MKKEEFENRYAERSGVTVDWLREHDQIALPCDCGESSCEGWQMAHLTPRSADFCPVCGAEVVKSKSKVSVGRTRG